MSCPIRAEINEYLQSGWFFLMLDKQEAEQEIEPLPEPVLVNGQRVEREEGEAYLLSQVLGLVGLEDTTPPNPQCALCDKRCENKWGNNGYPLTEGKICNACNDRVIHNRIMMTLDTIKGMDEDAPDDPE